MPVLEEPLYDYLSTELAPSVSDRVYPLRGPEGAGLPYVTYQRISTVRSYGHDPFGLERAWVQARVQFTVWAAEAQVAIEVAEAVVAALSGYSGPMGSLSVGRADVVFEMDDYQPATKLYRRIVDVLFAYQEGG